MDASLQAAIEQLRAAVGSLERDGSASCRTEVAGRLRTIADGLCGTSSSSGSSGGLGQEGERASSSGGARSDREVELDGVRVPVRVVAGEPIELVAIGVDDEDDNRLFVELHNPSSEPYSARGKLMFSNREGSTIGAHEFTMDAIAPLRSSMTTERVLIPDGVASLAVVVSVQIAD